jgi:hypothetical protein
MTPPESYIRDLERSHDELRAALIVAGRRIRQLTFGRTDDPALPKLREILTEARRLRKIRRDYGIVVRVRMI